MSESDASIIEAYENAVSGRERRAARRWIADRKEVAQRTRAAAQRLLAAHREGQRERVQRAMKAPDYGWGTTRVKPVDLSEPDAKARAPSAPAPEVPEGWRNARTIGDLIGESAYRLFYRARSDERSGRVTDPWGRRWILVRSPERMMASHGTSVYLYRLEREEEP